jgi:hypothetical protein
MSDEYLYTQIHIKQWHELPNFSSKTSGETRYKDIQI